MITTIIVWRRKYFSLMQDASGEITLLIVCTLYSNIPASLNALVTRVTPVGNRGKFTEEAKAIYSLVLKMQIVRQFIL